MKRENKLKIRLIVLVLLLLTAFGCRQNIFQTSPANNAPTTLKDVPALRLNFRFEPDVPAPTVAPAAQSDERSAGVQNDFDQNRAEELLDKTLTSPDKQRVLAIYHRTDDLPSEFRLDMYAADGRLLRKITYDGMAVHFAETIVWSPDSKTVAFVAMVRYNRAANTAPTETNTNANANMATNQSGDANANLENANIENANANIAVAPVNPANAPPVLTLQTEQIYICNQDGGDVKLLTQNEGLIYFYFVWSPDGTMLAALACTTQEWKFLQAQADYKGEAFTPAGRPRLVEKNGRERRLDDNLTIVRPVWSPDSAKVAVAFDKQVRIYDAAGNQPTQAAIPLRNQLLISSKTFDDNLTKEAQTTDNTNVAPTEMPQPNTLPDESSLVSFNPIVKLEWSQDSLLYLQTGYIKLMNNEADSARSYLRWHRLVFSPQAVALGN